MVFFVVVVVFVFCVLCGGGVVFFFFTLEIVCLTPTVYRRLETNFYKVECKNFNIDSCHLVSNK